MLNVVAIPAFTDNYIWCLQDKGKAILVDPGEARPALVYLQAHNLQLTDILVTHHHADHIGGINALLDIYPDTVVHGLKSPRVPQVSQVVVPEENCYLPSLGLTFDVLLLPGHTRDHIAFYHQEVGLFCGDTLFSGGCGRLFEGTPEQMYRSLSRLSALKDETKVYCTHEYTQANLRFAKTVEPGNQALARYSDWVDQQRSKQLPSLPSSIGQERAINPFLRCTSAQIRQQAEQYRGITLPTPEAVFAALRDWKDHF
ncbi:hydroxyacylglutathione hydrolase [Bowmanella denitrificans]|uniref:hydroxyacylglutathione hydrolase n=1 Tax=Bowmanella denitrificans TaxID=366582 RepID=UPI000C9BC91F|nr:hydroxyacylglutathione hydrolase [Bowmanella denitrificans]